MKKQWLEVKKFHEAFGHPVADKPTMMDAERAKNRSNWTVDEIQREFLEAKTVEDQADALADGLYFILGSYVEIGVNPEPIFDIVQGANMAKLFPDGKPRYRESDGKVVKPEGWVAPEPKIKEEIERQKNS